MLYIIEERFNLTFSLIKSLPTFCEFSFDSINLNGVNIFHHIYLNLVCELYIILIAFIVFNVFLHSKVIYLTNINKFHNSNNLKNSNKIPYLHTKQRTRRRIGHFK